MSDSWEIRYSSCEMMYLEVFETEVRIWLSHSQASADRYSFDAVLEGKMDGEVGSLFGKDVLAQLKAAVLARKEGRVPPVLDKNALRLARRAEKP